VLKPGGMASHCDITSTLHTSPEEIAGLFVGEVEWTGNTGCAREWSSQEWKTFPRSLRKVPPAGEHEPRPKLERLHPTHPIPLRRAAFRRVHYEMLNYRALRRDAEFVTEPRTGWL